MVDVSPRILACVLTRVKYCLEIGDEKRALGHLEVLVNSSQLKVRVELRAEEERRCAKQRELWQEEYDLAKAEDVW